MAGDTCVVEVCRNSWDESFISGVKNKYNCSGFVKAVAQKLAVYMPDGTADAIVEHLESHPLWRRLSDGLEARQKAQQGSFVIGGLKSSDHSPSRNNGHVAIIVGGALYRAKYPLCWGGSTSNAQSQGNKSIGEVWNARDRDNVQYYCYSSAVCPVNGG
jgi:cell wall-associated NlpC family hydrolase